ncbi:unnamed protein product [Linum trigynum]|uniref:Uncharacterized protein n=1 Tax=Linum trigynum TaxID=586398 RepID=A0AAV2G7J7_9ROSI
MVAKTFAKSANHPRHLFCGALITILAQYLVVSLEALTNIFAAVGSFYLTGDIIFNQGLSMHVEGYEWVEGLSLPPTESDKDDDDDDSDESSENESFLEEPLSPPEDLPP